MFFGYASFTSALSWVALFGWHQVKSLIAKFKIRRKSGWKTTISDQYPDQLNVLMRSYKEVPFSWFVAMFICSTVPVIIMIGLGHLFMPMWTYFVAIGTGGLVVLPLGWIYAQSNFQLVRPIGCSPRSISTDMARKLVP